MKAGIGAVFAAVVASTCCLGPVVFTAIGSGALAAASTKLASVRPVFLTLAVVLLSAGFYSPIARPVRTPHARTVRALLAPIARHASFYG